MRYKLAVGEQKYDVEVGDFADGVVPVSVNGEAYRVVIENFDEVNPDAVQPQSAPARAAATPSPPVRPVPAAPAPSRAPVAGDGTIMAPIPGRVLKISVAVGESVSAGQTAAIMEAMKMENNIVSTIDGTVSEIAVTEGAELANGQLIMIIE